MKLQEVWRFHLPASEQHCVALMSTEHPKPVQLCIFDTERDYPEGEEAQQILAYHPKSCSATDQTSVVGLAQALITFSANFDEARVIRDICNAILYASNSCLLCRRMPLVKACTLFEVRGPFTRQSQTWSC